MCLLCNSFQLWLQLYEKEEVVSDVQIESGKMMLSLVGFLIFEDASPSCSTQVCCLGYGKSFIPPLHIRMFHVCACAAVVSSHRTLCSLFLLFLARITPFPAFSSSLTRVD